VKIFKDEQARVAPLGDETRLIIKHMLAIAEMRKWVPLAADRTRNDQ
jgi:hypothetical protein